MGLCARIYKDHVPGSVWATIYLRLWHSGRLPDSFPQLESCGFRDFMRMVAAPDRYSWVIAHGDDVGGVVYLSDMAGTNARVHFAFLPVDGRRADGLPVPVAMGRFAAASILRDRRQDEDRGYILDSLTGVTPAYNTSAIKTVTRCGGKIIGEVPGACVVSGAKRNIPGVVTVYTRETAPEEWMEI